MNRKVSIGILFILLTIIPVIGEARGIFPIPPSWNLLLKDPEAKQIIDNLDSSVLYILDNDGSIRSYGNLNELGEHTLTQLDDKSDIEIKKIITDKWYLYQLRIDGSIYKEKSIWISTPGVWIADWEKLDSNPSTGQIAASADYIYQLRDDGSIWQYTGTRWQMLDNNPATKQIIANKVSSSLYQLHDDGSIWRYTGTACNVDWCPGWQMLDNNPATKQIVVAKGDNLYQIHEEGSIWQYTGTACNDDWCPGWQMLDNNPATQSILLITGNIAQRHNDGSIWKYSSDHWDLFNLPNFPICPDCYTKNLVGNDGTFALRSDGSIWSLNLGSI